MKIFTKMLAIILLISLTACTTWKTVPIDKAPQKLKKGDKVLLKTKYQGSQKIKIKSVTNEGVVDTKGREFDYEDMRRITRKQVSVTKTGASVVGTSASVTAFAATSAITILIPLISLGLTLAVLL